MSTAASDTGQCDGCLVRLPLHRLSAAWLCERCERRVALSELEHAAMVLGDEHPETRRARERARRSEGL